MTFPAGSVIVMMVLLNVACRYALPRGIFLRSRRRTRVFPFPPRRLSAIPCLLLRPATRQRDNTGSYDYWRFRDLALLATTHRSPWTPPRARVRARTLAPGRHSPSVP